MQWWIWLVAGGLLLIVEMATVDLLFASLALSSVTAALTSSLTDDLTLQGLVFAMTAVFSIAILRPIALNNLHKSTEGAFTNVEALIGTEATAISEIDRLSGQAKINGEIWSAHSRTGTIHKSATLRVISIEGATAIVAEKKAS